MEDKNKIIVIITTLSLALGIPIGVLVSDDAYKDYYVCDVNGDVQEFLGGISSTGYSGYPNAEDRKGAIRCGTTENKGTWVNMQQYSKDNGLDSEEIIEKDKSIIKEYLCGKECNLKV